MESQQTDNNYITIKARMRCKNRYGRAETAAHEESIELHIDETAIIVVDMWDKHWCKGANERIAVFAPKMNKILKIARNRGFMIIFAPSETLKAYEQTPQRQLMKQNLKNHPEIPIASSLNHWHSAGLREKICFPIVDRDGGCVDTPRCKTHIAWTRQLDSLEIHPGDGISDSGPEIYCFLKVNRVKNVIFMGVHTNMCVLGRPFGIRSLTTHGFRTFLVRDLTDTMYNPRQKPYVSHDQGTELVVEHIEAWWAPSFLSSDFETI